MAPSLGATWRAFWHTMTSYDRHAPHDSPYRTGQHMPLNTNRHAPLTSVATHGAASSAELNSPYIDDAASRSAFGLSNGYPGSPTGPPRPNSPYSPGMRSNSAANHKEPSAEASSFDHSTTGEIQLQNFQEGLPPPPPVAHSWKRIDRWAEDNYEELFDQLSEGATNNDLNELEHMLDCSLPMEVRESLQVHDGQERGGRPTGIIFGNMLLDCEEIVQEWQQWRKVNLEYLSDHRRPASQAPSKAFGASSSSTPPPTQSASPLWRQDLLAKQDSQPANAVQKVYAHPAWIPLARDWGGNNLAVDLAPGPAGKWGQVIIFGRDYDCKYVVARSWSAFLAMVADDLASEKVIVDEETQELKLREFKTTTVEPGYLDILRWRMDQKYGRKNARRRPPSGMHVQPGAGTHASTGGRNGSPTGTHGSPITSPTSADTDRGRSSHRFSTAPVASSPLARVNEEAATALNIKTGNDTANGAAVRPPKLVEVQTPVSALDESKGPVFDHGFADANAGTVKGLGVQGVQGVEGTSNETNLRGDGEQVAQTKPVIERERAGDGDGLRTVEL
ncbi:MAG: Cell wall assembly regulator [Thelocarpon superellum]|nr:MAG: Cell wall assembly regulator [Thelocarpon superellum]